MKPRKVHCSLYSEEKEKKIKDCSENPENEIHHVCEFFKVCSYMCRPATVTKFSVSLTTAKRWHIVSTDYLGKIQLN